MLLILCVHICFALFPFLTNAKIHFVLENAHASWTATTFFQFYRKRKLSDGKSVYFRFASTTTFELLTHSAIISSNCKRVKRASELLNVLQNNSSKNELSINSLWFICKVFLFHVNASLCKHLINDVYLFTHSGKKALSR